MFRQMTINCCYIPTVHFKTYELNLVRILQVVCMLVVWHDPATEHCQENTMKYVAVFVYVLAFEPL